MKILQINVRLNEGGAAGVALDLHRRVEQLQDFESSFFYGYSKHAKRNIREQELNANQIGSSCQVIINYVAHKILNYDIAIPTKFKKKKLLEAIEVADVVHLHVVHSYYISYSWLIDVLIKLNKKIVWTLHDHWILTGRCAFTDGCLKWQQQCGSCPTLSNYPPALIDRSEIELSRKRLSIERLIKHGCIFVSPSIHLKTDVKKTYPGMNLVVINNSLDLDTEALVVDLHNGTNLAESESINILIIAHDLSYEGKTDISFIVNIQSLPKVKIHTIGKNSPFVGDNVINHGYLSSKKELYDIYKKMSFMLFTSKVDNFPLVIGEALAVGLPVIATHSNASSEVLSLVGAVPGSQEEILFSVRDVNWLTTFYGGQSIDEIQSKALNVFSGNRMVREYIEIYE